MIINVLIVVLSVIYYISIAKADTGSVSERNSVERGKVIANRGYIPNAGYIPNESVAIDVAEAILKPIYGESNIIRQKLYHVELIDDIWLVEGTLPKDVIGGVFRVKIAKTDGRVLYLWHSQ